MYKISENDIRKYENNGFYFTNRLLDQSTINDLLSQVIRVFTGERDFENYPYKIFTPYNEDKLCKYDNVWWVNSVFRKVAFLAESARIAAKLMRVNSVRIWHDQLLRKPRSLNKVNSKQTRVGWHRDYAYWDSVSSPNMITIWYALQDCSQYNGTLNFIRGSNNYPRFKDEGDFFSYELENERKRISSLGYNWEEVPVILNAGSASFHHSLTIHGSYENMSDSDRLSYVVHYMPGESVLQSDGYPHTLARMHGPFVNSGDPFDDNRHPIVWKKC